MNENFDYKKAAEELWQLLYNIDTCSDIFKPTEERPKASMAFYNNALKYCSKRFDILKSDGYNLFTPVEYLQENKLKASQSLSKSTPKEQEKEAVSRIEELKNGIRNFKADLQKEMIKYPKTDTQLVVNLLGTILKSFDNL